MFRTVPLSIIRRFLLYTQQWCISYRFADSLRAAARKLSAYTIAVCTMKISWWWTEELSETYRVLFQKYIREIGASSWFYYKNLLSSSNQSLMHLLCINTLHYIPLRVSRGRRRHLHLRGYGLWLLLIISDLFEIWKIVHFTSTFWQVFTASCCAENRTDKRKTPWRWFQRAPKRVGLYNVTCYVQQGHWRLERRIQLIRT